MQRALGAALTIAFAVVACSSETTPEPDARTRTFDAVVHELEEKLALEHAVDFAAIRRRGHEALAASGANDDTLFRAIWEAMRATRKGHLLWTLANACDQPGRPATSGYSRYGACAIARGDGSFIVSETSGAGNPLGVAPGDRIVAVDEVRGDALVEAMLATPTCGVVPTSETARATLAMFALLATLREGSRVEIAPNGGGAARTVTLGPPPTGEPMWCVDEQSNASVTVARDDVAVLHVPTFLGTADRAFENALEAAVEEARKHRAVVIDVRGNRGGVPRLADELAGHLPNARAAELGRCSKRNGDTYEEETIYRLVPPAMPAFNGIPTVVLVDGRSGSSTDWFVRAARLATDAVVVGVPGVGFYSSITFGEEVAVPRSDPPMRLVLSNERCFAMDGSIFETRGERPDVVVEQTPEDVAAGRDTQLERAIDLALAPETDRAALRALRR